MYSTSQAENRRAGAKLHATTLNFSKRNHTKFGSTRVVCVYTQLYQKKQFSKTLWKLQAGRYQSNQFRRTSTGGFVLIPAIILVTTWY